MADRQFVAPFGTHSTPADWNLPAALEIDPKIVYAHFDGSGAAGAWIPCLRIISDSGHTAVEAVASTQVAAGASADVSWFLGVAPTVQQALVLPITETLYLNSVTGLVTSTTVLTNAVPFLISVQGTLSDWNLILNNGVPEADATFPTSNGDARITTQVGIDADTIFAYPTAHPQVIGHWTQLQFDSGSGFAHVEPIGGPYTTPQPQHFYTYSVTGQGSVISFKWVDSPLVDNYGSLKIVIYGLPAPSIAVTDGATTVGAATEVFFTAGATVTNPGGGIARVAINPVGTSPLTTKGDLYGHAAVDARIPIGANGQTLIADSSQALGLKWASPASVSGVMGRNVPPAGGIMETIPRWIATNSAAPPSGQVQAIPVYLDANVTITSISFANGATAGAALTHQVFGLYDSSLNRLATTTDDGATAWPINTIKTLNLTPGTFTTTYAGIHWIACLIVATTRPNLLTSAGGTIPTALRTVPYNTGQFDSGVTALPATLTLASSQGVEYYAFIS